MRPKDALYSKSLGYSVSVAFPLTRMKTLKKMAVKVRPELVELLKDFAPAQS